MDALELLLQRRSISRLIAPAPSDKVLENILQAGLRAPDHGGLKPWRFVQIADQGLERFSELLVEAALQEGNDEKAVDKARNAPFRAPLIITVIAHCQQHPKVPQWEQVVSAGCAVMAMQMAAQAQDYSGIWRTGPWTEHPLVREAFGCGELDRIVGFLYLGTAQFTPVSPVSPTETHPFVSYF